MTHVSPRRNIKNELSIRASPSFQVHFYVPTDISLLKTASQKKDPLLLQGVLRTKVDAVSTASAGNRHHSHNYLSSQRSSITSPSLSGDE